MKYKIEKNVPSPSVYNKNIYPFKTMEVGDSFFIKNREERDKVRVAAQGYRVRADPKFKVTIREVEGGFRLWRVEFQEKEAVSTKPVNKLKTA